MELSTLQFAAKAGGYFFLAKEKLLVRAAYILKVYS